MSSKQTAPIKIYMSEPRKERIKARAAAQGLTMTDYMARLAAMYERDPVAFEKLFHELEAQRREATK
jgi:hypothetical protein